MNLDATDMGALIAVLVMALVTLATRWGGVYAMSLIPISSRVRRFIQAMSGSVLVALLTPMAVTGDTGARLALLTTAVLMLVFKKPMLAIGCGILAAALMRIL